ncbi:MAG TPA: hypothetical protein PLZ57_07240 [Pseudobdellovibrionaceae bacterium]|nr:hypothetical protein [Pseudobdellovibrionaceae bacterium]
MRLNVLGPKSIARAIAVAACLTAELSIMTPAFAGGSVGFPITYPVICRGPEARAILHLRAPLAAGQRMVQATDFEGAVLHLTDRSEIRALEAKGVIVNTGHSMARLHDDLRTPQEFRTDHVSFLTQSSRVRYIGGGNVEYRAGATLAVESHHRSPVVLGMNEVDRRLNPLLQIDVLTTTTRDQSVQLNLLVNDYRPEVRRCTRTRLEPNPWASLSPSVPAMIEVCDQDTRVTPETLTPIHSTQMNFTACENLKF